MRISLLVVSLGVLIFCLCHRVAQPSARPAHAVARLAPLPKLPLLPPPPRITLLPVTNPARNASAPQPSVRELAPDRNEIRAEVAADPHSPPAGLIRFSIQLQQRRIAARKSETKAVQLFEELRSCALGELAQTTQNARAVCLLNARKMQVEHPGLTANYDRLAQQVDPSTALLVSSAVGP